MRFWCYTIIWTNRGAFVSMHLTLFLMLFLSASKCRLLEQMRANTHTHRTQNEVLWEFLSSPWFRCTECNLFSLILLMCVRWMFGPVYATQICSNEHHTKDKTFHPIHRYFSIFGNTTFHGRGNNSIHNYIDINPGQRVNVMESEKLDLTHRHRSMRLNCILWLFTLCWRQHAHRWKTDMLYDAPILILILMQKPKSICW